MLKVGIVGYGEWGPNMVRMFGHLPRVCVHAICDNNPKQLVKAEQVKGSASLLLNFSDMLKDIDAVVICSPPSTHYEFAKEALKKGIHVLVEKPFVLKLEEANELARLASTNKRVLMVGHILAYHPAVAYLRKHIASGKAGKICYLYTQRLNLGRVRCNENVIWSFGPHDISAILYLLGKLPVEVTVQSESYLQKQVVDVAFITLKFPGNILAHIHLSWLDPHKTRKMTIVGSKHMMVFDDMQSAQKISIFKRNMNSNNGTKHSDEAIRIKNGDAFAPSLPDLEPLKNECEHFLNCIRQNKPPLTGAENGTHVLKILMAAQESLKKNGKTVRIKWR